jgi:pimeloyl-ACP methyl ester carboxylesterase
VKIILWMVVVYAVICVVAYFGNRRFMYFPDPARTPPAEAGLDSIEEVEIATTDGVTLVAWQAPAKAPMASLWALVRRCDWQRKERRSPSRAIYFLLPLGLLLTDRYNNERNIRSVTASVLVLHGAQDAVIPVEMGWQVYRAANEPKRIEVFPQSAHSDFVRAWGVENSSGLSGFLKADSAAWRP